MKKNDARFVIWLSNNEQSKIRKALESVLDNDEDVENGMNSRVCDLIDTINVESL